MPLREKVCEVCGKMFQTGSHKAQYCPECRSARRLAMYAAMDDRLRPAAKAAAPSAPAPAPQTAETVHCETMHATIPASMCGTRGECQGKKGGKLCEHLPGRK